MLCDNDELEVHASHQHGVHCKYFQCIFFAVYFCCTLSIWMLSEVLGGGQGGVELEGSYIPYNNDELEVNASKSAWCELQIFPLQKICFFLLCSIFLSTLGIQVQRNDCNFEVDILCCMGHAYEQKKSLVPHMKVCTANFLILIKFKLSPHFILQIVEN